MIKAAVDFSGVEIFGDKGQSIDLRACAFRIDSPSPVSIRPTGRTKVNVAEGAHAKDSVRQV